MPPEYMKEHRELMQRIPSIIYPRRKSLYEKILEEVQKYYSEEKLKENKNLFTDYIIPWGIGIKLSILHLLL